MKEHTKVVIQFPINKLARPTNQNKNKNRDEWELLYYANLLSYYTIEFYL
jgi:hypothetical protein